MTNLIPFHVTTAITAYQSYTVYAASADEARARVEAALDGRAPEVLQNAILEPSYGDDEAVISVERIDE